MVKMMLYNETNVLYVFNERLICLDPGIIQGPSRHRESMVFDRLFFNYNISIFLIWDPGKKNNTFPCFFPQHLVEGLLNSRRRVSDRPSWILISKTPARKSEIVVIAFLFQRHLRRNLRRNPILGTQTFLT